MIPLGIVPHYATSGVDLEVLEACLKSLRESVGNAIDILLVDDCSPDEQVRSAAKTLAEKYDAAFHVQTENGGFSRAVNIGLRQARDEYRDAILINADIEIMRLNTDWLDRMVEQSCLNSDGPASVVGGLLVYPEGGLIQHAGIYFSLLTRRFDHLFKFGPMNLPAAKEPRTCPVTGALQFIRHEALTTVGVYDERFRMGMEDVDYCLRVFKAGRECVYQPKVRAWHAESLFRGRQGEKLEQWHAESFLNFMEKWQEQSFAGLIPNL